jgi:peptidoglycan L-alanyl-D-glutamate endopeptidase CwlK
MINSRSLDELLPPVRARVDQFLAEAKLHGIDLLVTSTYRDIESQDALYAQGRTTAGSIVTNARGGFSYHNFRCAIDVVPLVNGKANWNGSDPVWAKIGELGKAAGLEWAGEWKTFKELAHFQYTGGLSLADLNAGKTIPNKTLTA